MSVKLKKNVWQDNMKRILKNTATQAVVKISGTDVTEVIQFEQNLVAHNQVATNESSVGLQFAQWQVSSQAGNRVIVSRNGTEVATLYQNTGEQDFSGNNGYRDDVNSLDDISVQIIGTATVYLTLRKITGFQDQVGQSIDISYYPLDFGWIEVY